MTKYGIAFFLVFLSGIALAKPSEILVRAEGRAEVYLTYDNAPRMATVVLDALMKSDLSSSDVRWLSSGVFNIASVYPRQHFILERIKEQQFLAPSDSREQWSHLLKQLQNWHFSQRVMSPIDPDVTQLKKDVNPKLPGQWLVNLRSSPANVWVLGAVKQVEELRWKSREDIDYYFSQAGVSRLDYRAYVIQPDGHVEHHSAAYWQSNFQEIAPGAIIYVPLNFSPSSIHPEHTVENPNELVVELLKNRIL